MKILFIRLLWEFMLNIELKIILKILDIKLIKNVVKILNIKLIKICLYVLYIKLINKIVKIFILEIFKLKINMMNRIMLKIN